MTVFNLYVVRHGETYFNIYNKLQGWSNSPLTDRGIQNAQTTGERLKDIKFAAAYSSDTTRAQVTLQSILDINQASNIAPISTKYFREEFYGYFEGNDMDQTWLLAGGPHGLPTFKAIVEKYSLDKSKDLVKEADPFHQAENSSEYWQRLNQGFELLASNADIHDNDNVLLVSHGNTILSLVEKYGQGKYDVSIRPQNGSITKLIVSDNQIVVDQYNQ